MRHQRNEDSTLGEAGSSPISVNLGTKTKNSTVNSEFMLPDWKLEALVYAIAHSFIIGEKLMGDLKSNRIK